MNDVNTDPEIVNTEAASEAPPVTKSPRGRTEVDTVSGVTTYFVDGQAPRTASIVGMPDVSVRWLALRYLGTMLSSSDNIDALVAGLNKGEMPSRGVRAGAKPRQPTIWNQAIANALVETAKKAGTPIEPSAALAKAEALTRQERDLYRVDPAVVKHYGKLFAPTKSLADMLS